ncbi:MAG: M23 family metallopeptidase [Anaerolineales bacterium]
MTTLEAVLKRLRVFPVRGARPRDFTSTWGAPRPGRRTHKGVDIFCRDRTPLLAVEDGVITKIGYGSISGWRLWIGPRPGVSYWYYAHLHSYAPGIKKGAHVTAGQVIGYADRTGDAARTPTHLHFGCDVAGSGGAHWANPYSRLRHLLPLPASVSEFENEVRLAPMTRALQRGAGQSGKIRSR